MSPSRSFYPSIHSALADPFNPRDAGSLWFWGHETTTAVRHRDSALY